MFKRFIFEALCARALFKKVMFKRVMFKLAILRCGVIAPWVLFASVAFAQNSQITVQDYLGRSVTVDKPVRRIVALAPHIVENLFSAGAGQYIVGAVDYSDYPKSALDIPRVGAISAFSVEKIVALKPDLVVVWMSTKGGKVLHQLDKLGLTTYANAPHTLEDVARSIKDYGILAGTQAVANNAHDAFVTKLTGLKTRYGGQSPVSVLYQVWYKPLQTLNDEHIISDVIRLCGGINSFGQAPTLAPKISIEAVLQKDPDVIIASGMGEARPDWLDNWKRWGGLSAVKQNNLYFIPPDIIQRHTVRLLEGAQMMCEHLDAARQKPL